MGQPRDQVVLFWRHRELAALQLYDAGSTFPDIAKRLELINADHAAHIVSAGLKRRAQSRQRKGRKLNEKQVNTIRTAIREGNTHKEIAQWFGVTPSTIAKIAEGRIWQGR